MTDDLERLTKEVRTGTIEGTVEHPSTAEEYAVTFTSLTPDIEERLSELEGGARDGDEDRSDEFERYIVEELLVDPDWNRENTGKEWVNAIYIGYLNAINAGGQTIQDAMEMMSAIMDDADEGNE
ncbi:hypothetical protein ACFQL1_15915 [Halomicroarcula sp. GCM10025709]|uniref:hypothetical protein n=1 Tax=Haloarcula TaxID=2237 RepID=UPI0024C37D67|nr:hypothetical protein [Halomicroarcula sp. YJ-61-S]